MAQPTETDLLGIIKAFELAPLDPEGWTRALKMTSAAIGADATALEVADQRTGEVRLECPLLVDEAAQKLYQERVFHLNPRVDVGLAAPVGLCVDDSDLPDRPGAAEFYDWLRPMGLRYFLGTKVLQADGVVGFLTSNFSEKHGFPDSAAKRAQEALTPHIINAVAVGKILSQSAVRTLAFSETVLESSSAIAFIDVRGAIIEASPSFEAIVLNAGLLATTGGKLVAAQNADRARVAALIASAVHPRRNTSPPVSLLLRREGGRGLVLRVIPIHSRDGLLGILSPAAMVAVVDLDEPHRARRSEIAEVFALTSREADVASLLVEGYAIDEIAGKLGLSGHTTRQHLQGVFRKTGAQRQADVIRIVSRLP